MKHLRIFFLCTFALFLKMTGISQNRVDVDLPFEGVKINGEPVHGNIPNTVHYDNEIIEIKEGIGYIDIDIEPDSIKPYYVLINQSEYGSCCINDSKKPVMIKTLISNRKKHLKNDKRNNGCHDKQGRLQKTVLIPTNSIKKLEAVDLYRYLGCHPTPKELSNIVINYDTTKMIKVYDTIYDNMKCLWLKNNSGEFNHFVAYMKNNVGQILRLGHCEVLNNRTGALPFSNDVSSATFYVFYCKGYDLDWDCLDPGKGIIRCIKYNLWEKK